MKGGKPMEPAQTVFVIDDDAGTQRAMLWLLTSSGRHAEAFGSGEAFLHAYRPERSGCVILDLRLPGMSGLAVQEELTRRGLALPVIMLSGSPAVVHAVEALQRGALDFLEKPVDAPVLLKRVDHALALDRERRRRECLRHGYCARIERLTRREREVMALVVAGKANKVVAWELGISQKTVECHRARVMAKLEVSSLADLVRLDWMVAHGIPTTGSEITPRHAAVG
jgi:two-component system response regulator FixJ